MAQIVNFTKSQNHICITGDELREAKASGEIYGLPLVQRYIMFRYQLRRKFPSAKILNLRDFKCVFAANPKWALVN